MMHEAQLTQKSETKQLSVDQCCKFAERFHPHAKITEIPIEMNDRKCVCTLTRLLQLIN